MQKDASRSFVMDLMDLVVYAWKYLVLCIVVCLAAAVLYLWKATPLYAVKMQVRPGITAFDETGKEIRSWNVGDVMDFFRQDAYRAFLPEEGSVRRSLTLHPAQGRSATTVTVTLYHADPAEGVRILRQFYENVLQYYQTSGKEPLIAVSTKKIQERMQALESLIHQVDSVERPSLNMEIEARKANLLTKRQLLESVEKRLREISALKPDANMFHVLLEHESMVKTLRNEIAEESQVLASLQLARDALDMKKRRFEAEMALERQKLASLVPLEQVVPPVAGPSPVRPQKKWHVVGAVMAGSFLGLLLGLGMRERHFRKTTLR